MKLRPVIALALVITLMLTPQPKQAAASELVVGPGGYPSIGAAVAAAGPGSTIRIRAGTYPEQVTVTQPSITLAAFGDGPVWIDGQCQRQFGVRAEGPADNLTVSGLGVRNTTMNGIAIWAEKLPGQPRQGTFTNNTITDYNCTGSTEGEYLAGINVYYGGPNTTISGNTIKRRAALGDSDPNQRGMGNGIFFKGSSEQPTHGGHVITNNTIIGGYDGIGSQVEDDPNGGFWGDTLIANNSVTTCMDDGIQVEGGNRNVTVRDNRIRGCQMGIASAPNIVGPLSIEHNDIRSSFVGWAGALACFKVGNLATSAVTYYTNNFCLADNGVRDPSGASNKGDGWEQTNSGLGVIVSRGNTIVANRYVLEMNPNVDQTLAVLTSMDGDCLWTADTTRFTKWHNVLLKNIDALQSRTGMEPTGRGGSGGANPCSIPGDFGGPGDGSLPVSTPIPVPTSAPTPPPTATPATPSGGSIPDLTISSASPAPALTWSTSNGESGYIVVRIGGPGVTSLPVTGPQFGERTKSFTDWTAPDGISCYVVIPLVGAPPAPTNATSDLVCGARGGTTISSWTAPMMKLSLNQSSTATLSWSSPLAGPPDSYLLIPFGGSPVALPAGTTSTSVPISAPTCFTVAAVRGDGTTAYANIVCGAPPATERAASARRASR